PVDQPPWHHDLLVELASPFKIRDCDLAICTLAQGLQEFFRSEREYIALSLQRLLIWIHRVRHIDGNNEFDIDRDCVFAHIGEVPRGWRSRCRKRYTQSRGGRSHCQIACSPHVRMLA